MPERDPRHDLLFEPIAIGPKVLPNRFYSVAHTINMGSDQARGMAHYRAMKAQGGWGAVSTDLADIAFSSDPSPLATCSLRSDDDVAALRLMTDMVHEHGALAAVELHHGGVLAANLTSRETPIGVTEMSSDISFFSSCREMDEGEIAEAVAAYGRAAARARAAGFDIVTLLCAYGGDLTSQFLWPHYNRRTDGYGGALDNRLRFTREVIAAIRDAVEGECAISVRFGIDSFAPPFGIGASGIERKGEGLRVIELLDDLVDCWDIVAGTVAGWPEDVPSSRFSGENHSRDYMVGIKERARKPVICGGRFTSPDVMADVIRSGQCDIIGAARPAIADPFLPNKIRDGRPEDIRECIGCNVCVSRVEMCGPPIACTQNATIGEEFRRGWNPEVFAPLGRADTGILIVGAGPAGMECARVLGERGADQVHLVDAETTAGGHLRWMPDLPRLGEWRRALDYRQVQLEKLANVAVIKGRRLSADDVLEYGAEVVVVATGSRWASDGSTFARPGPIPGLEDAASMVHTPESVLVEGREPHGRVVVYDADGFVMGTGLAERFARAGASVTIVTPFEEAAPYTRWTGEHLRVALMLAEAGIEVVGSTVISRVSPGALELTHGFTGKRTTLEADALVLATGRSSEDALYRELVADPGRLAAHGIERVLRIGDAEAPGLLADAIWRGHRLGREFDIEVDPQRPYLREHLLPVV